MENPINERLKDKIVAITGGAKGNGFATAIRVGKEGAKVFIGDIDEDGLSTALNKLNKLGITAAGTILDVSNISTASEFISAVVKKFGRLDVFINNAGASKPSTFPEVTEEMWDWTMDINLKGAFFLMQEAAKIMIAQKSGSIINLASIAAIGGLTSSPPYAAAKAGLVNFTVVAAAYLAKYGIRVNAVAPGIVNTDFHDVLDKAVGQDKLGLKKGELMQNAAKAKVPLERMAEPEDVASIVAFLASSDAAYITSEVIMVTGGQKTV